MKAEQNDHGQDGKSQQDKWLKGWQQRMLNMTKVLAILYPELKELGINYDVKTQQLSFLHHADQKSIIEGRKKTLPS